jgi:hypothetical protein
MKTSKKKVYVWRMGPYGTAHLFKCSQYGVSGLCVCGKLDKQSTRKIVTYYADTPGCKSCISLRANGKGWS